MSPMERACNARRTFSSAYQALNCGNQISYYPTSLLPTPPRPSQLPVMILLCRPSMMKSAQRPLGLIAALLKWSISTRPPTWGANFLVSSPLRQTQLHLFRFPTTEFRLPGSPSPTTTLFIEELLRTAEKLHTSVEDFHARIYRRIGCMM